MATSYIDQRRLPIQRTLAALPQVVRTVALIALAAASVGGCALGDRPSFEDTATATAAGVTTGDAAIDAVLARLDKVSTAEFTAEFTAVATFGARTTPISVVQGGSPTRRTVSIGDINYRIDGTTASTCHAIETTCTDGIDAAAVSNTGVTPDFAFGALAKRLRRDAMAKIGSTTASTLEVAGAISTCVDVPVSGGTKVYCVLDNGVITHFAGGDVVIDLTTYSPTADAALFTST